ncbi:sensor histidine kinase [Paenibacillus pasadenensis]|uniref:ATP-binding protein n=1 Tax=Paenibacillus pasadenensis TaxID=217090 RepID=UPI0020416FE1|nr:sensor histidine kinase [Paenibacillus pasadenensis]MCM3747872.1 sensor histidine kinase [Paenibacillus pasadenensis]
MLFPVVLFLIFFENRSYSFNKKLLVALSAVALVLCIANPIILDNGFIFDLRYVPFIIVALFGGYKGAFPLYIVLNVYRFYVNGEGTLPSFLFSTSVLLLVPLCSSYFKKQSSKSRVITATTIAFATMAWYLLTLSFMIKSLNREFWILAANALSTHVIVTSVIMILLEKIIQNIKNRERLIQSERLSVVSELAASVSHEIKNPITVTSGFLQLLYKSPTISQEERRFVDLSLQELQRAEKIVSDFLSFAKPQRDNLIYSNMSEELDYTRNVIMPYASVHGVEVRYKFQNSLKCSYDRNQIQQCFINLFKNAVEAMKELGGGILTIEAFEDRSTIMIRIRDTGIGMSKEELSRLGKPYYSTKAEGTGLGMSMVYSTIQELGGTVEVHSEKGEGTTVLLFIPTKQ